MNLSKRAALSAYRLATQPYRWCARTLAQWRADVPISILFYHRVAEDPNPWTISHAAFEHQIKWLAAHFELISLTEAQRRIRDGFNPRPAVAITFDDGYAENCQRAIPFLLAHQVPLTYFVAWEHVRDQRPFAHDVARGRPLAVNSVESLRELAAAGVDIGSHSLTHADIGSLPNDRSLRREIVGSKTQLEQALGRPIRFFAFPFGQRVHLSPRAFDLGQEAGYWGMCSAYGGQNSVGGDAFHLQRIHGDPEWIYLRCWLDFDPRVRRVVPYAYRTENSTAGPRSSSAAKRTAEAECHGASL